MLSALSSLRQRILVIASTSDTDSSIAFRNYGAANADKMTWEDFQKLTGKLHSQYASISFFASTLVDFDTIATPTIMTQFYSLLHSGGIINFHLAIPKETGDEVVKKFNKACIYAGFIDPHITRDKENAQLRRTVQLVAQRPAWAQGSAASITADGLIDDSTLLDNDEYVAMGKGKSDCSSKPRACANCSCGRKELEVELGAEEAKKRLENAVVRSSCGSCYLGDAFRCSGCSFKGLPAFKPGEKIQLDVDQSNQGQSDLLLTESGDGLSSSSTGVLKLQV